MIKSYSQTFDQNTPLRMRTAFRFFRLLSAPLPVTIEFGRAGALTDMIESIDAGVYFRARPGSDDYTILKITNPSLQAVKFVLADDDAGFDRAFGTVSVDSIAALSGVAETNTLGSATAASVLLSAANLSRKYCSLQVPSGAAAGVWIRTDGGAATSAAPSIEILPGQTWAPLVPPTGQINVIRDAGAGANIAFSWTEG